MVRQSSVRFKVEPGDAPAEKAARRLHLTPAEFQKKLPELLARGFPQPDPTTGMFDLEAIDAWRRRRFPHLTNANDGLQRDPSVVRARLERLKHGH
jgi:hypothetical protein